MSNAYEAYYGPVDMDDFQQVEWAIFYNQQVANDRCPFSGETIPDCKSWLCDCFDFEDTHGVSQK
jgi:hypothetical protein